MKPITIPNISIPTIGIPTIGIPSVGFPSASDGGGLAWPAGMKEHIKAIYDPASQGMTNYDVIESYAEDFTIWGKKPERATITTTNKTINITNVKEPLLSIIEDNRIPFSDLVVEVTGVSEETYLTVRSGNLITQTIKTDGVYKISTNNKYLAFGVSKVGDCNITITQLPTSILKDLSGNGNHAYLYDGKGKLNSGMGVYKFDFLSDLRINSAYLPYTERQDDKICSLAGHPAGWLFQFTSLSDIPAFKVEVKGIVNDNFTYRWYDENGNRGVDIAINEDGIYELPMSYSVETNNGVGIGCNDLCQDNVCFTQLPDYPDQLCYDGKMYAVCYGFPILTDYTVMAERTWFDTLSSDKTFISKRNTDNSIAAFLFEKVSGVLQQITSSFGANNNIEFIQGISYQTKNRYNGVAIKSGNTTDNDTIVIGGSILNSHFSELGTGCHGKIIIADRSFTEEEINWLKDNWKKI